MILTKMGYGYGYDHFPRSAKSGVGGGYGYGNDFGLNGVAPWVGGGGYGNGYDFGQNGVGGYGNDLATARHSDGLAQNSAGCCLANYFRDPKSVTLL